jgi:D-lactate dehydrogenase (cytochrome)
MTSPSIDNAINILKQRFGDRLSTSESVRQHHSHTTTQIRSELPDAVIFVHSTEDVAAVVSVCQKHRCPVIPFGVGSSLEGHVNAPKGGISIDMNAMDKMLAVHEDDLDAVVQPGVTRELLNTH